MTEGVEREGGADTMELAALTVLPLSGSGGVEKLAKSVASFSNWIFCGVAVRPMSLSAWSLRACHSSSRCCEDTLPADDGRDIICFNVIESVVVLLC